MDIGVGAADGEGGDVALLAWGVTFTGLIHRLLSRMLIGPLAAQPSQE